jgi:DNA-binding response OmpR family regulator
MLPEEKKAPRILVIDDDEMLNLLLCQFLNSRGFHTLAASSIASAVEILRSDGAIDLLIVDYQLDDGVGIDLLTPEMTASYLSEAPTIMISKESGAEFLEKCFIGGVSDYLIKPINFPLLALKVQTLVKSINMQRLIRQQKDALENFKAEAKREEHIAKFIYEYLLRQNSYNYQGVEVWLKSFSAFSGDMTLVKKSPEGNLYFMLADATGHGLAAAITILPVVSIFNTMVDKGFRIQKLVSEINRKLVMDTPADRFVAAIVIEINPFRKSLSIWNGGMPAVLWVNQGRIMHQFRSNHMALGIMSPKMFDASVTTIDLPQEGFLFAHSDGLSEQENPLSECFSLERIYHAIIAQPDALLTELAQRLMSFAGTDNYNDDVSACVIRPALVLSDLTNLSAPAQKTLSTIQDSFAWSIKLGGRQLENCDIPPLCNHFLDQLGLDQYLCQKIFVVLTELVSNAIDYGVLGLSRDIKYGPNGHINYFYEREVRLKKLTKADFIKISIEAFPESNSCCLDIEVENSGVGYSETEFVSPTSNLDTALIHELCESVEIIAPGNKIRASIK